MNPGDTPGSQAMTPMAKYKLVFLGDQSVGKTSVINRFIFDVFDGKNHPTVGIDFISKTMHFDERQIRLQLWDTAGQERFRSLIPNYIRDSSVAVIVYDITNQITFDNVQKWYEDVRNQRGNDVIVVLVGNKTDLEDQRQVPKEEGEKRAKEYSIPFLEVSAKSGTNIEDLFKNIASLLPVMEASQILSTTYNFLNQQNSQRQQMVPEKNSRIVLQSNTNENIEEEKIKKNNCC